MTIVLDAMVFARLDAVVARPDCVRVHLHLHLSSSCLVTHKAQQSVSTFPG